MQQKMKTIRMCGRLETNDDDELSSIESVSDDNGDSVPN